MCVVVVCVEVCMDCECVVEWFLGIVFDVCVVEVWDECCIVWCVELVEIVECDVWVWYGG